MRGEHFTNENRRGRGGRLACADLRSALWLQIEETDDEVTPGMLRVVRAPFLDPRPWRGRGPGCDPEDFGVAQFMGFQS